MGHGAGEQAAIEHARHFHIVGKDGAALASFDRIHLRFRLIDDLGPGLSHRHRHAAGLGLRIQPAVGPAVRGWLVRGRPFAGSGRVAHVDCRGRRGLSLQLGRGPQDRLHWFHIACAAAKDAGNSGAHCSFTGLRLLVQQMLGGQNLRRRAIAALDCAALDKLLLQRGKARRQEISPATPSTFFAPIFQPFEGDDRCAVGLGSQQDAAVDKAIAGRVVRSTGEKNGVRAALASLIAVFEAEKTQTTQGCAQQFAGMTFDAVESSIDRESDRFTHC